MWDLIFYQGMLDMRNTGFCLLASKLSGYLAEYKSFQQRVAPQAVRTMQARCGYFTAGVQVFYTCLS
jgi:hypothetical protein